MSRRVKQQLGRPVGVLEGPAALLRMPLKHGDGNNNYRRP